VLKELGEDWMPGYNKPAFNLQASLVDAVMRWLDRHPDWPAPAARMAMGGRRHQRFEKKRNDMCRFLTD